MLHRQTKKEKDTGKLRSRFLNVTDYIVETEPKIKKRKRTQPNAEAGFFT